MAASKISLEFLIENAKRWIAERKEDGAVRVKITFGGDLKNMNEISFGITGYYKIEPSEVPAFHAAVKNAGGTPWDYYDDIEFLLP